ncbi:osteopetrosis-associated transmembrane protein 1 precursor domain-containing protein [Phthorimaea operculella]|nr:osteopetrosis-associated transmembrane protein 1 precursor domain-containing protein [Phthorimaea operculella]
MLRADISTEEIKTHNTLPYKVEGNPEVCTKILDSFAEYAANFTKCSIQHARPIRLCEECVEQYVRFDQKYQELLTTDVNGTTCRSLFMSQDRLDAVLEFHNNIAAIWDKGNCKSCFDWSGPVIQLSNSTKHFITLFNVTTNCITTYFNKSNYDEACKNCMQQYLELDRYYISLSPDAIGVDSVCMDIVDSMNATRSMWSKTLNCCKIRKTPEIIFLACTGIISSLPLFYYLAVRFCGPMRDLPKVLRQSRFHQQFLRAVNRNSN